MSADTPASRHGPASIRPAVAADIPTILEHRLAMLAAVFPDDGSGRPTVDDVQEANRAWIEAHFGLDFFVWIAERDGQALASAAILWFEHPPSQINPIGREAYVLNVYTEPAARRQGLARQLMERLLEEARAAGVGRVWLRASDEGRALYESLGLAPSNYLQVTFDRR